ncbi:MAG: hypothetical protein WCF85_17370 [Rhodospirillaceae bacterium]
MDRIVYKLDEKDWKDIEQRGGRRHQREAFLKTLPKNKDILTFGEIADDLSIPNGEF